MIRIVIIGSGNVARHLYHAFSIQPSVSIIQTYNRKGVSLNSNQKKNTIIQDINMLKDADVYIISVSDNAIHEVSSLLPFTNKLVVHTSGAVSIDKLSNHNKKGVLYPLQTFSKDRVIDFSNIPICIEAQNKTDCKIIETLAALLSNKIYTISSEQRSKLHLSAVFVNNFVNHLLAIGNDICNEQDIPFEILSPLIFETIKKAIETNPDEGQTGPAKRNDTQTIKKHLDMLTTISHKKIYQTITEAIQHKYGKKL